MAWKNVQYENGKYKTSEGGGGGSSTFADLDDVSFSNLQNGQVPKYNSTTQKWENADESGGGGTVTDVQVDGTSVVNPQTGVAEITMPTPPTIPVDDVEVNGVSVVNSQKVAEIKSYKEVTQAQYEALPDSKLSDNILYAIKDGGQAVDGFPPLIYSDEEREVGVWRDGKPLYEKTISLSPNTLIAVNDWTTIPGSPSSVDLITETIIVVQNQIKTESRALYPRHDTNVTIPRFQSVNGNICYYSNTSSFAFSDWYWYITFQYTKTTDTPGSGTWTTQGAIAHHYSTEEHIIGTWIDGKPLYEKTFYLDDRASNINNDILSTLDIENFIEGRWILWNGHIFKTYIIGYNDATKLITDKPDGWSYALIVQYTKTTD